MNKRPRMTNGWSRVTTVLSFLDASWKEHWLRKYGFEHCDRITKESSEFGSHVHKIVETWLLSQAIPEGYTEKEVAWATAIINWLSENKAVLVHINGKPCLEYEVKDEKLKLIGHLDAVFEINGENVLTDFKSTNEHRKSYPVQKAVYAKLLEGKLEVNKGLTIKVKKEQETPIVDVAWYPNLKKKYWPIFKAGYVFYRYMSGKVKI